jgi:hypothetical protein
MAERLGVNERTVRRDMKWRYDQFTAHGQHEVAVARTALMAEVGCTYAEAVRECEQAKLNGEPTFPYINSRVRALALMAKLTGAEMPAKLIVQAQIGVQHTVVPAVPKIAESELIRMAEIAAEVAAQAPKFGGNGHDRLAGNGRANRLLNRSK